MYKANKVCIVLLFIVLVPMFAAQAATEGKIGPVQYLDGIKMQKLMVEQGNELLKMRIETLTLEQSLKELKENPAAALKNSKTDLATNGDPAILNGIEGNHQNGLQPQPAQYSSQPDYVPAPLPTAPQPVKLKSSKKSKKETQPEKELPKIHRLSGFGGVYRAELMYPDGSILPIRTGDWILDHHYQINTIDDRGVEVINKKGKTRLALSASHAVTTESAGSSNAMSVESIHQSVSPPPDTIIPPVYMPGDQAMVLPFPD